MVGRPGRDQLRPGRPVARIRHRCSVHISRGGVSLKTTRRVAGGVLSRPVLYRARPSRRQDVPLLLRAPPASHAETRRLDAAAPQDDSPHENDARGGRQNMFKTGMQDAPCKDPLACCCGGLPCFLPFTNCYMRPIVRRPRTRPGVCFERSSRQATRRSRATWTRTCAARATTTAAASRPAPSATRATPAASPSRASAACPAR